MSKAIIEIVSDGTDGMTVTLGFGRDIPRTPEGINSMTPVERFAVMAYHRLVSELEAAPDNVENVTEH